MCNSDALWILASMELNWPSIKLQMFWWNNIKVYDFDTPCAYSSIKLFLQLQKKLNTMGFD